MKKAVIDIGTNSVKLTLGTESGIICDVNAITKLGEGLQVKRTLSLEAMERTARAVAKFAEFARREGAEEILCVGTMASRAASNADEFAVLVKELSGLDARTLSGCEEAELSAAAALSCVKDAERGFVTVFDTGGGSTEFVFTRDGRREGAVSVEAGAVALTEEHFASPPVKPEKVCSVTAALIEKFAAAGVGRESGRLVGTGGNVSAMAAVALGMREYDSRKINGFRLEKPAVMKQVALYAKSTAAERRAIMPLSPGRADIILGGACIVLAAMEAARADEITVSERSLRHELLRRLFGENPTAR